MDTQERMNLNANPPPLETSASDATIEDITLEVTEPAFVEASIQEESIISADTVTDAEKLQMMVAEALKKAIEASEMPFDAPVVCLVEETMLPINPMWIEDATNIEAIASASTVELATNTIQTDASIETIIPTTDTNNQVENLENIVPKSNTNHLNDAIESVETFEEVTLVAVEESSDSDSSYHSENEPSDSYTLLSTTLLPEEGDEDSQTFPTTKNESALPPVEMFDLQIKEDAILLKIGLVHAIVDSRVIVEAIASGDYKVLDCGSVLCLQNRTVIGVISDTFGKVSKPLYEIRFNTPEESLNPAFSVGSEVYTPSDHANYVFTQIIREKKGTDASNFFDESCGEDEREYSDDEMEMEAKRKRKGEREKKDVKRRDDGRDPKDGSLPARREGQRDQRQDKSDRREYQQNQPGRFNDSQRQYSQPQHLSMNQAPSNMQQQSHSAHINPNFQPFQPQRNMSYAPSNDFNRPNFSTPNQYNQQSQYSQQYAQQHQQQYIQPQQPHFNQFNQQGQFHPNQYSQMQQPDPAMMRMMYQQQYEQMQMMCGNQPQPQQSLYERDRDDYEEGEI